MPCICHQQALSKRKRASKFISEFASNSAHSYHSTAGTHADTQPSCCSTAGARADTQPKRHSLTATYQTLQHGTRNSVCDNYHHRLKHSSHSPQLSSSTNATGIFTRKRQHQTLIHYCQGSQEAGCPPTGPEQFSARAERLVLRSTRRRTTSKPRRAQTLQLGGRQLAAQQAAHDLVAGRARQGLTYHYLVRHTCAQFRSNLQIQP